MNDPKMMEEAKRKAAEEMNISPEELKMYEEHEQNMKKQQMADYEKMQQRQVRALTYLQACARQEWLPCTQVIDHTQVHAFDHPELGHVMLTVRQDTNTSVMYKYGPGGLEEVPIGGGQVMGSPHVPRTTHMRAVTINNRFYVI